MPLLEILNKTPKCWFNYFGIVYSIIIFLNTLLERWHKLTLDKAVWTGVSVIHRKGKVSGLMNNKGGRMDKKGRQGHGNPRKSQEEEIIQRGSQGPSDG